MELLIASQNQNKIQEIQKLLPNWEIKGISSVDFPHELREDGESLEENALQKMRQVYEKSGANCFADDTGLEVNALDGEPGVYSARYAGNGKSSEDNMTKLLAKMSGQSDRSAQFRTVIALHWQGEELLFQGICKGQISLQRMGEKGFGYDPIFIPKGSSLSFAQMDIELKNSMSHRGRAIAKLVEFLHTQV